MVSKSSTSITPALEARGVNVVRGLAMDAVQKANSGHPGTPMALAPLAHVLFTRVMRYDAADADWFDRDRFVLSNGHASMLLYSMLYLCGFGLELDDLRQFRQWGSRTPGHPEYRHTRGVEVTTGPLGQGVANGVGFALAEKHLRQRFGAEVCDHHVFGIAGDGCFMEGISHEAASFAGHFGLGKLVFVYDDNHITIDGATELSYSDDVPKRFEAYGWHVLQLGEEANDLDVLERGLRAGMAETERPSLLVLRSHIGWPSPKYTDTPEAHGNPLGDDEVRVTKGLLDLPADETFFVPDDVLAMYREAGARGAKVRDERETVRARWSASDPGRGAELDACIAGRGLEGWAAKLPQWAPGEQVATRNASKEVLTAIFDVVPGLVGGAADLTGNTGTLIKGAGIVDAHDASGRDVHFGIREHGMGSIANGMSCSSTLPFVGTFFVFSDYMRPSARLAALAQYKVAFVWSHDSVGVGEDGPTHQPIEQLASLRAMPNLSVIRPADANETSYAWQCHIDGDGPTAIILSRQNIPVLEGTAERAPQGVPRGAYVLVDEHNTQALQLVIIGTGSEVAVCAAAAATLRADGISVRVVSMPSWDRYEQQSDDYRASVLPAGVPALSVEAGTTFGWERYADASVGIDRFGASAPGKVALQNLGINDEHVVAQARALLTAKGK
ncbi:MAG TPA: transketolase [Acidimicrobiia bacterium]|jgi:transketolase